MIKKSKNMSWWLFAIFAFLIFIVLQIPASWLVSKFYKENQNLQNITGNIWNGQADWRKNQLSGTVSWTYRPLDLLFLKIAVDTEIRSGETYLQGIAGYSFGYFLLQSLDGTIAPETLKNLYQWQWPSTNIQIKNLNLKYSKTVGFEKVDGTVQWAGGELLYKNSQKIERVSIPALKGTALSDQGKFILDVRDMRDQKIANFSLDAALMLDTQLTQRFLMNVQGYDGKAAMDAYVISIRAPLIKGGM
jgi:general secretion pathway protein N